MPVPVPTLGKGWDVDLDARTESTSTYAKLGVSGTQSGETSLDRKTSVWDALVGKNAVAGSGASDRAIYETFWGIGLRIAIIFRSNEIKGSVDIASIAANAEYRKVDVQYEISSVGLGPVELAEVLSAIPPLGQFDMNAYSILESVRTRLVNSLQESLNNADHPAALLRPAVVSLARVPFADELTEAAEYRFAMQCIANSLPLAQALSRLSGPSWKSVRKHQVKAIYQRVVGGPDEPTAMAKREARSWLSATS